MAWGSNNYGEGTVPTGLNGVVAIAAGYCQSLALKADGTVVAWGFSYCGQSTVLANLGGVVAIAAGEEHSLALKADGTVVAWGDNTYAQCAVPPNLNGVVAIAGGQDHSLALKADGTVVAWGCNDYGDCSVPANLGGVVAIAAGGDISMALVGQPQALVVAPDAATVFASVQVGGRTEQPFTVSNPGGRRLLGAASVGQPFTVVAGGSYNLAPGQSQTVTVGYSPTAPGSDSSYVTFTGGASAVTRQVIGSAFNDPTPLTGSIAGSVTSSGQPINGAAITVIGPGANLFNGGSSPGTISGVIDGQAGSYLVSGLAPNAAYEVIATPPAGQLKQFYMADVDNVAVTAGQTTTVNIELSAIPSASQPPTLAPQETPVVLVRGTGPDNAWRDNDPSSEWGYWSALRSGLQAGGFDNIWDCNQPDNDASHVPSFPVYDGQGHVINGENSINYNARRLEYYVQQKALQFKRQNQCFPPSINIVAHSMGGLIVREAMTLSGSGVFSLYDSADQQLSTVGVNKVVMLGTPNAGSVLADEAGLYPAPSPGFNLVGPPRRT